MGDNIHPVTAYAFIQKLLLGLTADVLYTYKLPHFKLRVPPEKV